MKKYRVFVRKVVEFPLVVDAENEEVARRLAYREIHHIPEIENFLFIWELMNVIDPDEWKIEEIKGKKMGIQIARNIVDELKEVVGKGPDDNLALVKDFSSLTYHDLLFLEEIIQEAIELQSPKYMCNGCGKDLKKNEIHEILYKHYCCYCFKRMLEIEKEML